MRGASFSIAIDAPLPLIAPPQMYAPPAFHRAILSSPAIIDAALTAIRARHFARGHATLRKPSKRSRGRPRRRRQARFPPCRQADHFDSPRRGDDGFTALRFTLPMRLGASPKSRRDAVQLI